MLPKRCVSLTSLRFPGGEQSPPGASTKRAMNITYGNDPDDPTSAHDTRNSVYLLGVSLVLMAIIWAVANLIY